MSPTNTEIGLVPSSIRAAEYVRMSTDQQQFSIPMQQAAIRLYAAKRGFTVVRTYADEGISGLTLRERPAMKQLLSDVENHDGDFEVILVYDVSRWGRFQDTDEGAHHEFRCRRAGKRVEYCAEQFPNDNSPIASVMKAIKRAMAAEFSRELAVKVGAAQRRAAMQGFYNGGFPCYGLRRMLVDENRRPKGILGKGQHKGYRLDRVMIVPGPPDELAVVRRIFDLYVNQHMFKTDIASLLNQSGIPFRDGKLWKYENVRYLLANETYLGWIIYDRVTSNLRLGRIGEGFVKNPPAVWARGEAGFPPIVSPEIFAAANRPKAKPASWYPDDESLLYRLRLLLKKHGYLSHSIIEGAVGSPGAGTYYRRFGSLRAAYARVGYTVKPNAMGTRRYRKSKKIIVSLASLLMAKARNAGLIATWNWRSRRIKFANGYEVRLAVARNVPTRYARSPRWEFHSTNSRSPDLLLVVRLDESNNKPENCFLLPPSVLGKGHTYMDRRGKLDKFKCASLADALRVVLANAGAKSSYRADAKSD